MKKFILASLLIIASINMAHAQQSEKKVLRHIVMFGWSEGKDSAGIKQLVTDIKKLPSQISFIKGFEYGTNNSPENLNQGLTYCFQLTFASEKDRDAYLVHPAHKAFVAANKANIEKVTVFDYWATEVR